MTGDPARAEVLRRHGAREEDLPALLAYTRLSPWPGELPELSGLPDEPFAQAWDGYAARAAEEGAAAVLRHALVQLRFPVARGISGDPSYLASTRRGAEPPEDDGGLRLVRPGALRIFVHPTPAGRVPVVVAGAREDFVALVRALTRRNEPDPVPDSMGACIVAGYNNWDRVRALREDWEAQHPGAPPEAWAAAFREIVPCRELYQDRFLLLSTGPYSAVPAHELALDDAAWAELSLTIRLEHECAHYFTRRVFGCMKSSLHDELLADYAGIVAAAGRFRADWFLRFMGLDRFPGCRADGRIHNYRGDPPLSDAAFAVVASLVRSAALNLERWDAGAEAGEASDPAGAWPQRLAALARTPLEALGVQPGMP